MIGSAFTLGLSTGFFCLGYCAPVLTAFLLSGEQNGLKDNLRAFGLFLSGRLIAYLLFGAASHLAGRMLGHSTLFTNGVLPLGELLLGGLMLGYALGFALPHASLCRTTLTLFNRNRLLFTAGFCTGINICPPFLLAVTEAMRSASLLGSLLFFLVFFLTTTIYLVPFVFSGMAARNRELRSAARIACGLGGAWFLYRGLALLVTGGSPGL